MLYWIWSGDFSEFVSGPAILVRLPIPKFSESTRLRYRCHATQREKTRIVSGMVIAGKSHHCRLTMIDSPPLSLALVSKNTMLNRACRYNSIIHLFVNIASCHVMLTETKVPGWKNMVTTAILNIDVFSWNEDPSKHARRRTLSLRSYRVE